MNLKVKDATKAVRCALYTGIAASTLTLGTAIAAEENPAELEKVQVTGSHIKQIDIEGANPIAVITREDIELSGLQSVADVLRRTPYNQFGSYRETSGGNWGGQAFVDLRGLGAGRTLVLLNGHRLPASPVSTNWAVDLNTIPLAAVERIDIYKDSASAIYGSEAIGGVVNIILRKDYEGVELSGTGEWPSEDGGDGESASFVAGGTHAKGRYLATIEYRHKDIIWSKDRPWSKSDPGDGVYFETTQGMNEGGNTWVDLDTYAYTAGTPCDYPMAGIYEWLTYPGDTSCNFAYADFEALTQEIEKASGYLYLDYDINTETTLYFQNVVSRVEAYGQYAPAVGAFFVAGDNPINQIGTDALLYHRFASAGNRKDTTTNVQWDSMLGLKGVFRDIDYDVFLRYNLYDSDDKGRNYILDSVAVDLVASGDYDPFDPYSDDPAHQAAVDLMRYDTSRDIEDNYFNAGFNLTGEMAFELPGGNLAWAAGYEYRDEDYKDIYDAQRRANNVLGSSGGSSKGDRTQSAIYGEVMFPLMDNLELTAALRYDDYSDFGSETSPQIKARWQPMDNLMLRASWGQGFRAPSLADLYTVAAQSFEYVQDWVNCDASGISPDDCPVQQVETYFGGNTELEPETSDSINLGVVFEPVDNLVLGVDYYNIDLDDVITELSPQTLINMEADGLTLPAGTEVIRNDGGRVSTIYSVTHNIAKRSVEGLDFTLSYEWDFGEWGLLKPTLTYTHINEYKFQPTDLDEAEDIAGDWAGGPDNRAQLVMRWDVDEYTFGWITDYIGSMNAYPNNIPSYTEHTLTATWHAPWDADISFGARNIFEEDPPIDTSVDDASYFYYLYPIDGRVLSLTYTQRF